MNEDTAEQGRDAHAQAVLTLAAAMLRWGMWLTVPVALVTTGVATIMAGAPGLAGAGFGVVLGFGSALITIAAMRFAANRPVQSVLGIALGSYALKMSALLVVMLAFGNIAALHHTALGLALLVTVVSWAVADVIAFQRARIPTIILPDPVPGNAAEHGT